MRNGQYLLVGLGNPGNEYAETRHNAGAMCLDFLRVQWQYPDFSLEKSLNALVSKQSHILFFPQTFMNNSGESVRRFIAYDHLSSNQLIVLHDDKDLIFGEYTIQNNRGSAGQKGVQSIIDALGTKEFLRVRIGIGPVPEFMETDDFVLQRLTPEEQRHLKKTIFPAIQKELEQRLREDTSFAKT